MESKEFFEKYIGVEVERIYHFPDGRGGSKSVTLCFKGGDSLRIEPCHNGLNPFVKLTEARWDLMEAVEEKEIGIL